MKLPRITIGGVEGLVGEVNINMLSFLGNGSISCSHFGYILKMRTPTGVIKVGAPKSIKDASRKGFLGYVNNFLASRRLYLTNADYSPRKLDGLCPHKLTGILHHEEKPQES